MSEILAELRELEPNTQSVCQTCGFEGDAKVSVNYHKLQALISSYEKLEHEHEKTLQLINGRY